MPISIREFTISMCRKMRFKMPSDAYVAYWYGMENGVIDAPEGDPYRSADEILLAEIRAGKQEYYRSLLPQGGGSLKPLAQVVSGVPMDPEEAAAEEDAAEVK